MDKNPTSTFKIGGILRKKMFRKFVETSVIISLEKGDWLYFEEKFQKLFQVEKNPTSSLKKKKKEKEKKKKKKKKKKR